MAYARAGVGPLSMQGMQTLTTSYPSVSALISGWIQATSSRYCMGIIRGKRQANHVDGGGSEKYRHLWSINRFGKRARVSAKWGRGGV